MNTLNKVVSRVEVSDEDLRRAGIPTTLANDPDFVRVAYPLEDYDRFDPGFFRMTPWEAETMDPQHRQFLECCWEVLDSSGINPGEFEGDVAIFGGSGHNAYLPFNLLTNEAYMSETDMFMTRHTGNDKDFLTTRVSYCLGLKGPSVNVQTACSTSLVSVHMACQSLLTGECDVALAGGVTIELPHRSGYLYRDGEILSSDGYCRAFDASSEGTVFGSGVGVVALKNASDAHRDNDNILAIIKSTAVNNDGAQKAGYLAPSSSGQSDVISEALEIAGLEPKDISYVECHGTGTRIGDSIEMEALRAVFDGSIGPCAIGSAKPNIGHLDTAAGVASLIKVVMALNSRTLPPMANFRDPNPECGFNESNFFVPEEPKPWVADAGPLRAGVTSLGVGGTNAHVIVEQPPAEAREIQEGATETQNAFLFPVSSSHAEGVGEMVAKLGKHLETVEVELADVARSLWSRASFRYRYCEQARTKTELLEKWSRFRVPTQNPVNGRQLVFMFSGGGAYFPGMASEYYASEPVFREHFEECINCCVPDRADKIRRVLLTRDEALATDLEDPEIGLPSIFITQYCLAKSAIGAGLTPDWLIGHSLGDYCGACISGVFSLQDAIDLVTLRGRLLGSVTGGEMLSVMGAEDRVRRLLPPEVSVAAVNAPDMLVLSGLGSLLADVAEALAGEGFETRRIPIATAAHSSLLDPLLDEFREGLSAIPMQAPKMRMVSNLSGAELTSEEATSPEYWVQHLRQTVLFSKGLEFACQEPSLLIEVGAGTTLSSFVRMHSDLDARTLQTIPKDDSVGQEPIADLRSQAWSNGSNVPADEQAGFLVGLPTYAFAKERHWVEPGGQGLHAHASATRHGSEPGIWVSEWCQVEDTAIAEDVPLDVNSVLYIVDGSPFAQAVAAEVPPNRIGNLNASLDAVFRERSGLSGTCRIVILCTDTNDENDVELALTNLLDFVRRFASQHLEDKTEILCIGPGVHGPTTMSSGNGLARVLVAALKVATTEIENLWLRTVDTGLINANRPSDQQLAKARSEVGRSFDSSKRWVDERLIGARRMAMGWRKLQPEPEASALRHGGHYVITGGSGGIAGVLTAYLRDNFEASVSLISRGPAPDSRASPVKGAAVHYVDWNSVDTVAGCLKELSEKAPIDGVFHAAGTIDDELIARKSNDALLNVFRAKSVSTANLLNAMRDHDADFVCLFSSVSSILGLEGQFDYAAGNAYLESRTGTIGSTRVFTALWGRWEETGMALRLRRGFDVENIDDPVLEYRLTETNAWGLDLNERAWYVDEHRTSTGTAVVPGSFYVSLVLQALRKTGVSSSAGVCIEELTFVEPCAVSEEVVPLTIEFLGNAEGEEPREFRVTSSGQEIIHVYGRLGCADLGEREDAGQPIEAPGQKLSTPKNPFMRFGERWTVMDTLSEEDTSAKARFVTRFAAELDDFPFHPATLDAILSVAQSAAQDAIGDNMLVPYSYKGLRLFRPISSECYAEGRITRTDLSAGFVDFSVVAYSDSGEKILDIERFRMRVVEPAVLSGTPTTGDAAGLRNSEAFALLEQFLANGEHGAAALVRENLAEVETQRSSFSAAYEEDRSFDRSQLSTAYEAPGNDLQAAIHSVWSDALHIKEIGIDDNFFELGGHSLLMTRMIARLQAQAGVTVPTDTAFTDPTIRSWSLSVAQNSEAIKGAEPAPSIQRVSRDKYRA